MANEEFLKKGREEQMKAMRINPDGTMTETTMENFLREIGEAIRKETPVKGRTHDNTLSGDGQGAPRVENTGIKTKQKFWPVFAKLIEEQFAHGGEKYHLEGQDDKEFTDLVCEASPGKSGFDWVLQTIIKYCGRYIQFQREKDLLKIATYAFIAWLKSGAHLVAEHDTDTRSDGKHTSICCEECKEPCEEPLVEFTPDHEFKLD